MKRIATEEPKITYTRVGNRLYVCRLGDLACLARRVHVSGRGGVWETSVPGSRQWSSCPTSSAASTRASAVEAHFFFHRKDELPAGSKQSVTKPLSTEEAVRAYAEKHGLWKDKLRTARRPAMPAEHPRAIVAQRVPPAEVEAMIGVSAKDHPWPHQNVATCPTTEPVGVDLFDDEEPGFVSIYLRHADGALWPARTVDTSLPDHAERVIAAWSLRGGVVDHRTKQGSP